MANGAAGRFMAPAAHHSGPGYRDTGGSVAVLHLDQWATTALAYQSREKTAVSKCVKFYGLFIYNFKEYCEAQGKGRSKGRLRKVTQRSLIDYRLSIIDILSLS